MRATNNADSAKELLGVVLSNAQMIEDMNIESDARFTYFLDDYVSWFDMKEGTVADLLLISPCTESGQPTLKIGISEAKFVSYDGYQNHARKSIRQLKNTIQKFSSVVGDGENIAREVWLEKLSDLLLEAGKTLSPNLHNELDLIKWADLLRNGQLKLKIQGYSHVFVYEDESGMLDEGELEYIESVGDCSQKIFNQSQVIDAIKNFYTVKETEKKNQNMLTKLPDNLYDDQTSIIDSNVHKLFGDNQKIPSIPQVAHGRSTAEELRIENSEKKVESENRAKSNSENTSQPSNEGETSNQVDEWMSRVVNELKMAFRKFEFPCQILGEPRLTPNAALIKIRGKEGLSVKGIMSKSEELLTVHELRVLGVEPDIGHITVMIERPNRATLSLPEVWDKREQKSEPKPYNSNFVIGLCEKNGAPLYLNLSGSCGGFNEHAPHTLIAGGTGSGKGVLLQILLLDICATNSPKFANVFLIDAKAGLDFFWMNELDHLAYPVITDQKDAIETMEYLVREMEDRYQMLAKCQARDIDSYNEKVNISKRIPRIYLIHDEFADWMMNKQYRDSVNESISRLGVKARAAGIHLIVATQRPDNNVITTQLRANLLNRLVLKMADEKNSNLVLDQSGAEKLLGKGHLIAKLDGENERIFAQVPYANEKEINDLVKDISAKWK